MKKKIIRVTTVPQSLNLIKGQISFLKREYDMEIISSYDSIIDDIAFREGVTYHIVNMQRHISPIKDFVSIIKMYRMLKREKPFIVHSMTPKAGMVTMIAAFFARVPYRIHTFTGLIFPTCRGLKKFVLILIDRITCLCATKVIPEGEGVKRDLISYKITNKDIKVIGNGNVNGIDVDYFSKNNISSEELIKIRRKYKIEDSDFIFISIGRVVRDKGIIELVSAFKEFNYKYPNSKLFVVGDFERELDPLPEKIEIEIKNNKSIIYCGYQTDIRPFLVLADLFIFPSYREGFPNVVMQAGAMEVPSIVTNINGSNEIIHNGVNGIIINPKDVKALIEKMEYLYLNINVLLALKSKCREMIVNRYKQTFVWNELLRMYNSMK